MVLTQRAVELRQPLHDALEGVRRVVADGMRSDPATMEATLVIAASDYMQYVLLTRFSVALRTEAPKVRIAWRALDVLALSSQLERGKVDLALASPDHAPAAMRQRQGLSDRKVSGLRPVQIWKCAGRCNGECWPALWST